MRPDDHDLMRMADDGCPNHLAAEPDEGIAKLLADTRLHETNLALARRELAKTGETCELPDYEDNGPYGPTYGGEGWGDDSGRYDDDPNVYEGTYSEE